jgi:hypothetical protein
MSTTATEQAHRELRDAQAADERAIDEALHKGLIATQPLTITRLAELCALGEKMLRTGIRKRTALARVSELPT